MKTETNLPALRLVFLVATPKIARKADALFTAGGVPTYYQFHGDGTASSEIMEILGGGTDKVILMSMMPKTAADRMLRRMNKELRLSDPNSGIAFSAAINGSSGALLKRMIEMLNQNGVALQVKERNWLDMAEMQYALIMVIVDQGYNDDVMDAARSAGAHGGTIIHARQAVNAETMKVWGISIQPEREIIMILADREKKMAIMKAVGEKCGMNSEAKGIVFSVPVDEAVGLD